MLDVDAIRALEEMSFRGWPALETERYDGWVLRFANGYTGRSNSINPLHSSTLDLSEKIAHCDAWFAARGLKSIFRLNPTMQPPELDAHLEALGYHCYNDSYLMTNALKPSDLAALSTPAEARFVAESVPTEQWLTHLGRMNERHGANIDTLRLLFDRMPPKRIFGTVMVDDAVVAVGIGVIDEGYISLYDVVTDEAFRGQGYGRTLVAGFLRAACEDGTKNAFLQVAADNEPAKRLYQRLGYQIVYPYWYRTKVD